MSCTTRCPAASPGGEPADQGLEHEDEHVAHGDSHRDLAARGQLWPSVAVCQRVQVPVDWAVLVVLARPARWSAAGTVTNSRCCGSCRAGRDPGRGGQLISGPHDGAEKEQGQDHRECRKPAGAPAGVPMPGRATPAPCGAPCADRPVIVRSQKYLPDGPPVACWPSYRSLSTRPGGGASGPARTTLPGSSVAARNAT